MMDKVRVSIKEQKACIVATIKRDAFSIERLSDICQKQGKVGSLQQVKKSLIDDIKKDQMPVVDMLALYDAVPEEVRRETLGLDTPPDPAPVAESPKPPEQASKPYPSTKKQ